jgi:glycerate-2-kinase
VDVIIAQAVAPRCDCPSTRASDRVLLCAYGCRPADLVVAALGGVGGALSHFLAAYTPVQHSPRQIQ